MNFSLLGDSLIINKIVSPICHHVLVLLFPSRPSRGLCASIYTLHNLK